MDQKLVGWYAASILTHFGFLFLPRIFCRDMRSVFPFVITTDMQFLLKFCFATLFYSKAILLEKVGSESPIRSNVIFRNSSTLRSGLNWIGIRYAHQEHNDIDLTGIPPHVTLFVNLEKILDRPLGLVR
jgi:hypothetical protein